MTKSKPDTVKTCMDCDSTGIIKIGDYWLCTVHEREFRQWEQENRGFCREVWHEFQLLVDVDDEIRVLRGRA